MNRLDETTANPAETATINLRSDAPFNLFEMERILIFGPFWVSMPYTPGYYRVGSNSTAAMVCIVSGQYGDLAIRNYSP